MGQKLCSSKKKSSSFDDLPLDILQEILIRLPAKSLIKLKCVSKTCYSIINDVKFTRIHATRVSTVDFKDTHGFRTLLGDYENDSCLLYHSLAYVAPIDEENVPNGHLLHYHSQDFLRPCLSVPVSSCDGLLLFLNGPRHLHTSKYAHSHFMVWNPSINQGIKIPLPLHSVPLNDVYGVGYDSCRKCYKILRAPFCSNVEDTRVTFDVKKKLDIYSFETNSWKPLQDAKDFLHLPVEMQSTTVNRRPHWLAYHQAASLYVVLYFDAAEENVGALQLPALRKPIVHRRRRNVSLRDFRGCLSFTEFNPRTDTIVLWSMTEYGVDKSWSKLLTISCSTGHEHSYLMKPFFITKTGKVLFVLRNRKLVVYDPKRHVFSKSFRSCCMDYKVSISYVESLVSPFQLGPYKDT